MAITHHKSRLGQLGTALLSLATNPGVLISFGKQSLKAPIVHIASQEVEATPAISFIELFPALSDVQVTLKSESLQRHTWNVRLDEEVYIGLAIKCMHARRIFEIGTFNGETTRYMAESAGPEASIFTLDLPPSEFDRSQSPANFTGSQVGSKFKGTSVASQITQLLGDSTTFDYSPYYSNIDFVFVDAAHDYMHGYADSQTALRLVRPGGLIFWHDFTSYWSGLVHGIRQATIDLPLKRLSSTTLAVLKTEE